MHYKQKLKWLTGVAFACLGCLWTTLSQETIEASRLGATHIGTFEGSTTFTTSSSSGINPGLFIEVIDDNGKLTQYESEEGIITIPNTKEGAYVTQAKLLGKTKYRDQDTNELLETWEEGRNLTLVSVENPVLTTVGKNLFDPSETTDGYGFSAEQIIKKEDWFITGYIEVEPNAIYRMSCHTNQTMNGKRVHFYDKDKNLIAHDRFENDIITVPNNEEIVYMRTNAPLLGKEFLQIEKGSKATAYLPFRESVLEGKEELVLHGVGDVKDELNLITGKLTEFIGEIILGGRESWITYALDDIKAPDIIGGYLNFPAIKTKAKSVFCDKLKTFDSDVFPGSVRVNEEGITSSTQGVPYIKFSIKRERLETLDREGFKKFLSQNPLTVQYQLANVSFRVIGIDATYQFSLLNQSFVELEGMITPVITSVIVPSKSLTFVLNPNQEGEQQFISPEFEITNESNAPLTLTFKTFEQTTDVLNDVLPSKYKSWEGLTKEQSKDIALGLVSKPSTGWLSRVDDVHYVSGTNNKLLGTIKPKGTVGFEFIAHHGQAFSEMLSPSYRLTFVFNLMK